MRRALFCLIVLVSVSVQAQELKIQDVAVPELQWGTNVATVTVVNEGAVPHTLTVDIQVRGEDSGGVGWQTQHPLSPGQRARIQREFFIKPLPGKVVVRAVLASEGKSLWTGSYNDAFPIRSEMAPVRISYDPIWREGPVKVPPSVHEYPPLKRAEHAPFVFYYMPGDGYAESHLRQLAVERRAALVRLSRELGIRFCGTIAFYLFPNEVSKFAYTFHRGEGWAVGPSTIVEIYNPKQHLDPNHELVHILTYGAGEPPALFREGLAAYLQHDAVWDGYPVNAWVRSFSDSRMLLPLDDLFGFTEIGSDESRPAIAYPEAASFVGYLRRHYGMAKVMQAYATLKSSDDPHWREENRRKFAHVFGKDLQEAGEDWLRAVAAGSVRVPAAKIADIQQKSAH